MNHLLFLAQDAPPPSQPGGLGVFMPIILMMVMVYFLAIRPQRKKQAEMQAQVDAMKIGDKVITAGGVHGMVTNVKDKTAIVKVADNVKIEFEKSSLAQVFKKDGGDSEEPSPSEEEAK